jgi:CheY-like chemotaxis protein
MKNPAPSRRRSLLIAEDDPDILWNLVDCFGLIGYEARSAETGGAALAIALEMEPELIVTDLVMPGLSGFELLKKIAAVSGAPSPPAIALSARVEPEAMEQAAELGVAKCLNKPFRLAELTESVAAVLPA